LAVPEAAKAYVAIPANSLVGKQASVRSFVTSSGQEMSSARGSNQEGKLFELCESTRDVEFGIIGASQNGLEVGSLCRDSGHLEVADSKIGEMLASWPKPEVEGEIWPCEEICDAIEEVASDDLDHGFQIGTLNSRGVVGRSPLIGGEPERQEAAKYRRWAEFCDVDWPRTAASLRRVADSYDLDAQREDARAREFAEDRR